MLEKVHLHDLLDLHAARAQKGDVSREPPLAVGRERCVYTKCYCEENVYQLCADALRSSLPLEVYAVVVSNSLKQVPFWTHVSGSSSLQAVSSSSEESDPGSGSDEADEELTVWDYHWFMLCRRAGGQWWVYDFDSTLPFPCLFSTYALRALRCDLVLNDDFARRYRVVPAERLLREFASDRSHMLRADGTYSSPPPAYPPIMMEEKNNLQEYTDMHSTRRGPVLNIDQLLDRFLAPRRARSRHRVSPTLY